MKDKFPHIILGLVVFIILSYAYLQLVCLAVQIFITWKEMNNE